MISGSVYVLHSSAMPDFVKVGLTTKPVEERARALSDRTAVACPFSVVYAHDFENVRIAERNVHKRLDRYRVPNREFFRVTVPAAVSAVLEEAVESNTPDRVGALFQSVHRRDLSRSIAYTSTATSAWETFKNVVIEADEWMKSIGADAAHSALSDVLYQLAWERGVSPVRWIIENRLLSEQLARQEAGGELPTDIARQVESSVSRLQKRPSDRSFL